MLLFSEVITGKFKLVRDGKLKPLKVQRTTHVCSWLGGPSPNTTRSTEQPQVRAVEKQTKPQRSETETLRGTHKDRARRVPPGAEEPRSFKAITAAGGPRAGPRTNANATAQSRRPRCV